APGSPRASTRPAGLGRRSSTGCSVLARLPAPRCTAYSTAASVWCWSWIPQQRKQRSIGLRRWAKRPTSSARSSSKNPARRARSLFSGSANMKRLVILISGRGSNMSAILDAVGDGRIDGEVMAVISNRTDAAGLALAADRGIATMAIDHRAYPDRDAFETALTAAIDAHAPDLIVLAGFMRILSPAFVDR